MPNTIAAMNPNAISAMSTLSLWVISIRASFAGYPDDEDPRGTCHAPPIIGCDILGDKSDPMLQCVNSWLIHNAGKSNGE